MALLNKRNVIIGVLVLGVAGVLSYRFIKPQATEDALGREVSTTASFEAPNGTDTVRFTLGLDADGLVTSVRTTDVLAGDTTDEHLDEFSSGLLLVIKGKKLSELEAVDRVGTSSLTTKAFNSALPALQAQL